jgi:hypothetical protein
MMLIEINHPWDSRTAQPTPKPVLPGGTSDAMSALENPPQSTANRVAKSNPELRYAALQRWWDFCDISAIAHAMASTVPSVCLNVGLVMPQCASRQNARAEQERLAAVSAAQETPQRRCLVQHRANRAGTQN